MKDPCVLGALTLIFGLLASLQGVRANEAVQKCDNLSCPKGFTCCDNECCPEGKAWDPEKDPLMYLFLTLLVMVVLWCICGTVECLYSNCKIEQHDGRTGDHQTTPEPPSFTPLESIWVTSLDPPPPYSQAVQKCDILSCPKGFTCCDNECCPERIVWDPKIWVPKIEALRILFIIMMVMVALFCIRELVRRFCPKCRKWQHDVRTGDHQTPPEPPSIAPLESIWVTSLGPPPSYSQVVLNPTPTDPPPPYSPRAEGPAGQMRGDAYDTL